MIMAEKFVDYVHSLWTEREGTKGTLLSHCQECAEFFLPRRSDITEKQTPGSKRHERVFRNIGEDNLRTWATGMMNGIFPVNRVFHSNAFVGVDLDETPEEGRRWLEFVTKAQYWAVQNSNFYYAAHSGFLDEGCFGTSAMFVEESRTPGRIVNFKLFSIENYVIIEDDEGNPNGCVLRDHYTPVQLASKFGIDALSPDLKRKAEKGDTKTRVKCYLGIVENETYNPAKTGTRGMSMADNRPYRAIYYVDEGKHVLAEDGFYEFPVIFTRINKNYNECYGRAPAMSALHAYKILTKMSESDIIAYERHARPGYLIDSYSVMGKPNPGPAQFTVWDSSKGKAPVMPWPTAENPSVGQQAEEIYRREVEVAFMRDVFFTLNAEDIAKAGITATQLSISKAERLAQVGPHLKINEREKITPIMNRIFGIQWRNGMIPDPPQGMQGMQFEAQPTSPIFAAVESATEVEAIERKMQYCASVEARYPAIWDRFNFDAAYDIIATSGSGTATKTDIPLEEANKVRQQRAEQQAAQEQMMLAAAAQEQA
jgi:hypothetical protein